MQSVPKSIRALKEKLSILFEPKIVTEKWLLDYGFKQYSNFILLNDFEISVSWWDTEVKNIVINLVPWNTYVYIRNGKKDVRREYDDLVCVFNSDIQGKLYTRYIRDLYFILTGKKLIRVKNHNEQS